MKSDFFIICEKSKLDIDYQGLPIKNLLHNKDPMFHDGLSVMGFFSWQSLDTVTESTPSLAWKSLNDVIKFSLNRIVCTIILFEWVDNFGLIGSDWNPLRF